MTRYIVSTIVGDLTISDPKYDEGLGINVTLKTGEAVDLNNLGFDDVAIRKSQRLRNAIDRLKWVKVLTEAEYNDAISEKKPKFIKSVSQAFTVSGVSEENLFDEALREVEDKEEIRNDKTAVSRTSRLTKPKVTKE